VRDAEFQDTPVGEHTCITQARCREEHDMYIGVGTLILVIILVLLLA